MPSPTYTIDEVARKVFVWPELPGEEGSGSNHGSFETLEAYRPGMLFSVDERRQQVYLIARDELIERGVING